MHIAPKYFDIQSAPMAYYKFLTKFALILGLILSILNTFSLIASGPYMADIIYNFAVVLLDIASLMFLNRMEWTGVLTLCSTHLFNIVYNFYVFFLWLAMGLDPTLYFINNFVTAAVLIPTWIYFCKRRPLFKPYQVAIPREQYEAQEAQMQYSSVVGGAYTVDQSTGEVIMQEDQNTQPKEGVYTRATRPEVEPIPPKSLHQGDVDTKKWKVISCVLSAVLIISIILNGFFLANRAQMQNEYNSLQESVKEYSEKAAGFASDVYAYMKYMELEESTDILQSQHILSEAIKFASLKP